MAEPTIQYAFTAGEFSPTLYGRTDLQKYDLGVSRAYNMFVDYRGGLSTRAGLEYGVELVNPDDTTRIYSFDFGVDIANTYILVFGDQYVRFIQDGGYLVESSTAITAATQADPGVITSTAHGLTTGDLVFIDSVAGMTELNGRLFLVTVLTVNTFSLQEPYSSTTDVDTTGYTAYTSGGTVARIYTVTTPYAESDLDRLVAEQRRDTVTLTHPDYPINTLVRNDATDWTISEVSFSSSISAPTNLAGTASGAGSASVGYIVTAVRDSEESLPTRMLVLSSIVNFTSTSGQVNLTWDAVSDVDFYRIYRTTIAPNSTGTVAAELAGYLGTSYSPAFTDTNIIPDFTDTPPEFFDPFADGAVEHINITAGGSGYSQATATVGVTGGSGTGFSGYPVVNSSGAIIGVYILNSGKNYTTPVVSFTGGTGAAATATLTTTGGNAPRASKIFQQRQIYGGTDNAPLGVWGSKPGYFTNFDTATIITDGDSYQFDLDAERVNPIRYFIALRRGLIAFTGSGVWNLTGGDNISITPLNVDADAQTYIGSDDVKPVAIDNDILYVQKENGVVRALSYDRVNDVYTGIDRSLLANHLIGVGKNITRWAWAQAPFYLIWSVREDGRFLTMTYIRNQDIYAWTQHETLGQMKDVASVEEAGVNVAYFIVERTINGVVRKFVERIRNRAGANAEDYVCVDSAVSTGPTPQSGTIRVSAATGSVTVTVTGATPFVVGDVGSDIRVNNGRIEITGFTSSTQVTGTVRVPLTDLLPDGVPLPTPIWYLDAPFTTVSGLWHLEGESVAIQANGTPQARQTVSSGTVTVPTGTTLAHVGLPYTCQLQTLPAISRSRLIEGKTRSPVSVDLRVNLARGLYIGTEEDNLYFIVERSTEPYDTATALQSGIKSVPVNATYDRDAFVIVEIRDPLPATILGYTLYLDVGDDDDES